MFRLFPVPALLAFVFVVAALVHIEIVIATHYAPEAVLLQVYETKGLLEGEAQCFADISSLTVNVKKKPLRALSSIYDYLNPSSFFASIDQGFHLLETDLKEYQGPFEIRIVCYAKDFRGVSYTVINNENQNECGVENSGKVVVC